MGFWVNQESMSDDMYFAFGKYLSKKNITLKTFCEKHSLPFYLVKKIVDRKIKMKMMPAFIQKIANICDLDDDLILFESEIKKEDYLLK